MYIVQTLGDFLLSTWLWNVTFDWVHPFFTGIIMFFMFRIIMRKKRIKSFLVSFGVQLGAFALLHLLVVYGLIMALNWHYEPIDARTAMVFVNEFSASLAVGIVYALLQSLYFLLGALIWNYNVFAYFIITLISNGIGMLFSYFFIRMVIMWQYVA